MSINQYVSASTYIYLCLSLSTSLSLYSVYTQTDTCMRKHVCFHVYMLTNMLESVCMYVLPKEAVVVQGSTQYPFLCANILTFGTVVGGGLLST